MRSQRTFRRVSFFYRPFSRLLRSGRQSAPMALYFSLFQFWSSSLRVLLVLPIGHRRKRRSLVHPISFLCKYGLYHYLFFLCQHYFSVVHPMFSFSWYFPSLLVYFKRYGVIRVHVGLRRPPKHVATITPRCVLFRVSVRFSVHLSAGQTIVVISPPLSRVRRLRRVRCSVVGPERVVVRPNLFLLSPTRGDSLQNSSLADRQRYFLWGCLYYHQGRVIQSKVLLNGPLSH